MMGLYLESPVFVFEHLVLSVCSNRGEGWRFVMAGAQTVYVDDSGTDGQSYIAAAAFCVSTVERWQELLDKWNKIADYAGFELKAFHTTEFAACRRDHLCQQCQNAHTTAKDHPWQRWADDKRESVLRRMAKALVKHVEFGVGQSYTKADFDEHVRDSPVQSMLQEPIAEEYVTFAIQRCGGSFAEWRVANSRDDRLKFVFDTSSKKEKKDIARVFFGAANGRAKGGRESQQRLDPEEGVSYENRRTTHQLLSADMVAWTVGRIRALDMFGREGGRFVEAFWLAKVFAASENVKIGYLSKETLALWESRTLTETNPKATGDV
jgi:hypothetical protein